MKACLWERLQSYTCTAGCFAHRSFHPDIYYLLNSSSTQWLHIQAPTTKHKFLPGWRSSRNLTIQTLPHEPSSEIKRKTLNGASRSDLTRGKKGWNKWTDSSLVTKGQLGREKKNTPSRGSGREWKMVRWADGDRKGEKVSKRVVKAWVLCNNVAGETRPVA